MSPKDIIEVLLSDVGTVAFLVLVLVAGARQYWVWGWTYQREVREKQEWRRIALSTGRLADNAIAKLVSRERGPFEEGDESW